MQTATQTDTVIEEMCILQLCPAQQDVNLLKDEATEVDDTWSTDTLDGHSETEEGDSLKTDATGSSVAAPQNSASHPLNICSKYSLGMCSFGKEGIGCPFDHPTACKPLLRSGQWGRYGCAKGKDCDFHHPACREALQQNFCKWGVRCRFQHPLSWKIIVGDVNLLKK